MARNPSIVRELVKVVLFLRQGGATMQKMDKEPVLCPRGEVPLAKARGHEATKILFVYADGASSLRTAKGKRAPMDPLSAFWLRKALGRA